MANATSGTTTPTRMQPQATGLAGLGSLNPTYSGPTIGPATPGGLSFGTLTGGHSSTPFADPTAAPITPRPTTGPSIMEQWQAVEYGQPAAPSNRIAEIYQNTLGRAPDEAGAQYWANQISSGALTERQVYEALANSEEGQARSAAHLQDPETQARIAARIAPYRPNAFTNASDRFDEAAGMARNLGNAQNREYEAFTMQAPGAVSVGNVNAGMLRDADMNAYMNPYTQQVIDRSMMDMDRARMMAMNDVGAQATQAGAFGGSRHGLVEAETNRNFADRAGAMAAGLRQNAFQNAQAAAQYDLGNQFQADQFNVGNRFAADQFNIGNQFNANANNMAAINRAREFNASGYNQAQLANQQARLGAANTMLGIGNAQFNAGLGLTNLQRQIGADQRGIQQQVLNNAMGQYGNTVNAPMQGLNMLTGVLSGMPKSTTQTTSSNPGLLGTLGMLAAL